MQPVIIEVAINGSCSKARNPHVPIGPEEIAADAIACLDAGASIIHSHIESFELNGKQAAERYLQGWLPALEARPDAIFYGTGAVAPTIEQRCSHTEALAESGAMRMGFIDPGSVNLGGLMEDGLPRLGQSVYANSFDDIDYSFRQLERLRLGPSIAVYEPGFLRTSIAYHRGGKLPRGAFVKFYFAGDHNFLDGAPGYPLFGLPATERGLEAYLEMLDGSELPWAAAVMGGDVGACGMAKLAIERGGHVRVGLEDHASRTRAPSNAELVAEIAAIARRAGRAVATPEQTTRILSLPRQENELDQK